MTWEEILKKLKATYKEKGLSDKILEVFAKRIASTAEEDKIDEAITNLESELTLQQMLHDQIRTLKSENEKLRGQITEGADETNPEPNPQKKDEDEKPEADDKNQPPAWAKELMEVVAELKAEKAQATTAQKLQSKFKELKISEAFYRGRTKGMTFKNDEEMEQFVNEVKEDFEALKTEIGVIEGGGVNPDFSNDPNDKPKTSSLMNNYIKTKSNAKDN